MKFDRDVNNTLLADNAYRSTWRQFDYYGLVINTMPDFPTPGSYQAFNFYANNFGDESTTNIGSVVAVDTNNQYTFITNVEYQCMIIIYNLLNILNIPLNVYT